MKKHLPVSVTACWNTWVHKMNETADFWIKELNLQPHPEGGFFREVYRSGEQPGSLPSRYHGDRSFATSIYFLLTGNDSSAFHRIMSDETWHYYFGSSMILYTLDEESGLHTIELGNNPRMGQFLQYTIPHGTWFGGHPANEKSYSLLGCTVTPGFDFADFELGEFEKLSRTFPEHTELLKKFCIK